MNTAFRHARLGKQSQSSDTRPASIFKVKLNCSLVQAWPLFLEPVCVSGGRWPWRKGRPHPLCLLPRSSALGLTAWVVALPDSSAGHLWAVPFAHNPVWLFCSAPFLHTGGMTLWNHPEEESRSCGNLQLAFLQATFIQISELHRVRRSRPPIGSSLSGPHWGLVSTEDLLSSLRGTSKEGWKGKWRSRS